MAASRDAFQSRHRKILVRTFAQVGPAVPGLDYDCLVTALWRSAAKSRIEDAGMEAYLTSLKLRDLALAAACAAGAEPAWTLFVKEMQGPLRRAGRAMAGDRGEEIADSLFTDLYTRREAKLGSFAGRSSLAGWLRAVLHQTYMDHLRAGKRLVPLEPENPREDAPAREIPAPPAADPVEEAQNAGMAARVWDRAWAALPARQRLFLDYYYRHGLTLKEAAALLKVHEATASREMDRARVALKKHLTELLVAEYRLSAEQVRECLLKAAEGGWAWTPETAQENRAPAVPNHEVRGVP